MTKTWREYSTRDLRIKLAIIKTLLEDKGIPVLVRQAAWDSASKIAKELKQRKESTVC